MKILDEIMCKDGIYYIGISKLTCWPCDATLVIFNKNNNTSTIEFSGTHGGTYPSWEAPNWISANPQIKHQFLEYLIKEAGKHYKGKEVYPYVDNFIPPEPILVRYDNQQEVLKHLENLEIRLEHNDDSFISIEKDIFRLEQNKVELRSKPDNIQSSNLENDTTNTKQNIVQKLKSVVTELNSITSSLNIAQKAENEFKTILQNNIPDDNKWATLREFLNNDNVSGGKQVVADIRNDKTLQHSSDKIQTASEKYYAKLNVLEKQSAQNRLTQEQIVLEEQLKIIGSVTQQKHNIIESSKSAISNLDKKIAEHALLLQKIKQNSFCINEEYIKLKHIWEMFDKSSTTYMQKKKIEESKESIDKTEHQQYTDQSHNYYYSHNNTETAGDLANQ
jgi:hypothetical protein